MYIQGMAVQTQIFLLCIGFGFCLGIIFELIKLIRKIISHSKYAVLAQDILGFIIFTMLIFLFLLCVSNGELRVYSLFGLMAGYVIYYFTLGFLLAALFEKIEACTGKFKNIFKNIIIKIKKHKKIKNKI